MDSERRIHFCICCMSGIPGSGKSTVCHQLKPLLEENILVFTLHYDKILLDSDSDTAQLWKSLTYENDDSSSKMKLARAQILKLTEFLIQEIMMGRIKSTINEPTKPGYISDVVWHCFMTSCWNNILACDLDNIRQVLFIIDDNMYFSSMRYEYYKLAKLYRTGFCEIFVDCSIDNAKTRNRQRHGRDFVEDQVIDRMHQKLENPDSSKHAWEKYNVVLNTDNSVNLKDVIPIIGEAFSNPACSSLQVDTDEMLKSQAICSSNLIHQVDLMLRKCISRTMVQGKNNSKDMKQLSQQVLSVKNNILCLMKRGEICIPESINSSDTTDSSKNEASELFRYIEQIFDCSLKLC